MVQYQGSAGGGVGPPAGSYNAQVIAKLKKDAEKKAAEQAAASLGAVLPINATGQFVDNTDYLAQAKQMYSPQFDYLDQQSAQAQQRAAANKAALGSLYDQVAKEILGSQTGIKKNYGEGLAGTKGAYDAAYRDVGGAFDKSQSDQLAILERLGINQAAPEMLEQNSNARALLQGIIGANNQASQNALQQMQQGALTFNTEQGNITRQAGAEAQAGVGRQLEDLLGQIAGTRADLMGQVNQSAMGMRSDAAKQQQQYESNLYERMKDERDFQYRMGKDKADMELRLRQMAQSDAPKLDPLGEVNALASQLYGNPQAASNASKAVMDALMAGGGTINSADDLIKLVIDRNRRANGQVNDANELARLAALAFQEMFGKASPSSLPY